MITFNRLSATYRNKKFTHIISLCLCNTCRFKNSHLELFLLLSSYYFLLDLLFISHLDHPVSLPPRHKHPHTKSFQPKVMALVFLYIRYHTGHICICSVIANRKAIQRTHLNFLKTATCQKDKITANQSSSLEPKLKSNIPDKRKLYNFKLNHHILSFVPTNTYL